MSKIKKIQSHILQLSKKIIKIKYMPPASFLITLLAYKKALLATQKATKARYKALEKSLGKSLNNLDADRRSVKNQMKIAQSIKDRLTIAMRQTHKEILEIKEKIKNS